jgi:hypothetical protein
MNKVQLRETAIVDLNTTFARKMGENKIRHYKVPYSKVILGFDPLELVKQHIEAQEGPSEFEVSDISFSAPQYEGGVIQYKDASFILDAYPDLEAALRALSVKSTIHQDVTIFPLSWKQKVFNLLFPYANKVIGAVNAVLRFFQRKKIAELNKLWDQVHYFNFEEDLEKAYAVQRSVVLLRPLEPYIEDETRQYNVATSLVVGFEEGEEEEAAEALVNDLKLVHDKALIKGHLCMPSLIQLADTVGSGKKWYALFCIFFLDNARARFYSGCDEKVSFIEVEKKLGLKNSVPEGGVNYLNGISPTEKYDVEYVYVASSYEENRKASEEAYQESRPVVEKVTKEVRKLIKQYEDKKPKDNS